MVKFKIILFLLLPLIPLSKLFPLSGHVVSPPRPVLTFSNVKEGKFQEAVEKDFTRHFGAFNPLVYLDNTLNLSLAETNLNKSTCVVVGRDEVFLSGDEVALRDQTVFDWPAIEAGVQEMADAVTKLKKNGVEVVVLFVPSKLRYYPDFIPSRWRVGDHSPPKFLAVTDRMLLLMNEKRIPILDTREVIEEVGQATGSLAIPKRGRHWTNLTSCQILGRFERPGFDCLPGKVEPSKKNEQDIYRCLNAFNPLAGPELLPQPQILGESFKRFKKALFVGSSFMRELEDQALRQSLFSELNLYYYNKTDYQGEDGRPIPEGQAWREFILSRDLIVIDLYEVQLNLFDHGFSKRVNQEL